MANRKGIHPQDVRLHGWPLWRGGLVTVGPGVVLGGLLGASVVTTALGVLGVRPRSRLLRRATVAGALAAGVYAVLLRPWHRHWGLTREERLRTYPGDERITRPVSHATHALTIDARPADVWPWLVQLGFQRGGWYSHDWLEKAAGVGDFVDGRSAERIIPELQGLKRGDLICTAPGACFTVVTLDAPRALVLALNDPATNRPASLDTASNALFMPTTWAFVLDEQPDGTTRLIVRMRSESRPRWVGALMNAPLIELPHFIMERRMMRGLKARAERRARETNLASTVVVEPVGGEAPPMGGY